MDQLRSRDVVVGLTGDMRKAVAYTQPRTAMGCWADGETRLGKGDYVDAGSGHMRVTQYTPGLLIGWWRRKEKESENLKNSFKCNSGDWLRKLWHTRVTE